MKCKLENGQYTKNFSFSFPFTINIEEGVIKELFSTTSKIRITPSIIRVLIKLAQDDVFNDRNSLQSLYDDLDNVVEAIKIHYDNEGSTDIENMVWTITKELLIFEPGYIRYDYDTERVDPLLHPLHHVDLFYSSQATFKLGINDSLIKNGVMGRNDLINVLDITTPCYYLILSE